MIIFDNHIENVCCHKDCFNGKDKEHQSPKHNPDDCCSSHINPFFHTCNCANGFFPVFNKDISLILDLFRIQSFYKSFYSSKEIKPIWQPPKYIA